MKKGYNIIGIDNLSYGIIEQVPDNVAFHNEDICSKSIYHIFEDVDIVFHLAAKNCIADCQIDPVETALINVVGTVNVFEACKQAGVKKVIYAESSAVYEGSELFPTPETNEKPKSIYAISKMASKLFADGYSDSSNLPLIALRYFNVYGPKQDYRRSIPPLMCAFIMALLKGERPVIYGDGGKKRDFIYIDDVNQFHELIIKSKDLMNGTYNIGFGENYSVLDIYNKISNLLGIHIEPEFRPDLPGEAFQTLADISDAQNLGWRPKIKIDEGLKLSIDYIQKYVL